jgi:hypothetical protein
MTHRPHEQRLRDRSSALSGAPITCAGLDIRVASATAAEVVTASSADTSFEPIFSTIACTYQVTGHHN